ncbi:MAG: hypothetical protein FD126_3379, partial [Elusimicrobia bacterium]
RLRPQVRGRHLSVDNLQRGRMSAVTRRLIVTADDFGISTAVNEAVRRGYRDGVLRFASLMVTGEAAADAVDIARRDCPGLGVGLHLVLCSGRPALRPESLEGLLESDGRFPDDPVLCGLRYFFDGGAERRLERELRAQFERFLATGLRPAHVDGHLNIHAHPVVFPLVMRLAREHGFSRVRLPGGEFGVSFGYSRRPLGKQLLEAAVFGMLRAYLLRSHADPRIEVPQRVYGLLRSGLMREEYVREAVRRLPPGTTEIYFHPSADPASEAGAEPRPGHHTCTELRTLTSPGLKTFLDDEGISLVTANV